MCTVEDLDEVERLAEKIYCPWDTALVTSTSTKPLPTTTAHALHTLLSEKSDRSILHAVFIDVSLDFQAPEGRNPRVLRVSAPEN